jgi:hypothetical protein
MLTENPRTEGTRASVHRECEGLNRRLSGDDSQDAANPVWRREREAASC